MNCFVCAKEDTRSCSGCKKVAYCSVEHQRSDWPNHKKVCPPFKIAKDDQGSKFVVATREIGQGEMILSDTQPIFQIPPPTCCGIVGIRDHLHLHCITCGIKFGIDYSKRCRRCGWPVCGPECEKAQIHAENECQVFRETHENFPEEFVCSQKPNCLVNRVVTARMTQMKKHRPDDWAYVQEFMDSNKIMNFPPLPAEMAGFWNSRMTNVLDVATIRQLGKKCGFAQAERILPGANLEYKDALDFLGLGLGGHVIKQRPAELIGLYKIGSLFKQSSTPNCNWELGIGLSLGIKSAVRIKTGTTLTIKPYSSVSPCGCGSMNHHGHM